MLSIYFIFSSLTTFILKHDTKVLHTQQSPDGSCVVSAAADETLRFWDVFGSPPSKSRKDVFPIGGFSGGTSILR